MEGEVWLNIDYGQFEVTQTSVDSVAGKIATKIYSGRDQNNENFFKVKKQSANEKTHYFLFNT